MLVDLMTERVILVHFLKEGLTFTGEDAPMANLMFSVTGAVAQFERDLIRERQREGIELAKITGANKGRKRKFSPERAEELNRRLAEGEEKASLARESASIAQQSIGMWDGPQWKPRPLPKSQEH